MLTRLAVWATAVLDRLGLWLPFLFLRRSLSGDRLRPRSGFALRRTRSCGPRWADSVPTTLLSTDISWRSRRRAKAPRFGSGCPIPTRPSPQPHTEGVAKQRRERHVGGQHHADTSSFCM